MRVNGADNRNHVILIQQRGRHPAVFQAGIFTGDNINIKVGQLTFFHQIFKFKRRPDAGNTGHQQRARFFLRGPEDIPARLIQRDDLFSDLLDVFCSAISLATFSARRVVTLSTTTSGP